MKLNAPQGFTPYRGATISSAYDASGALYWVCTAAFPDKRFGTTVFRQVGEQQSTFVFELPHFCSGRGSISADGRITAWTSDGTDPYTFVIPGFQVLKAGTTVPVNVPSPTTVVDPTARSDAAKALAAVQDALKKLTKVSDLATQALQVANSKPSVEVVWQKALDAAYGLLKDHGLLPK